MWRFPAEAGENGGGAFVLFYILCVVLIGLPILLSEVLIGRHGQSNAPESVRRVAEESGQSSRWAILADFGVLGAFMVLSFYCVVGGWVVSGGVVGGCVPPSHTGVDQSEGHCSFWPFETKINSEFIGMGT